MGILDSLLQNASEVDAASLEKEYGPLLIEGEMIEHAYKLIRDKLVFTNKRMIMLDVQGVTGKKREYLSVPYHSVEVFSVETAGTLDFDSDLKVWVKGHADPFVQKFGRGVDIKEVERILARYVLK